MLLVKYYIHPSGLHDFSHVLHQNILNFIRTLFCCWNVLVSASSYSQTQSFVKNIVFILHCRSSYKPLPRFFSIYTSQFSRSPQGHLIALLAARRFETTFNAHKHQSPSTSIRVLREFHVSYHFSIHYAPTLHPLFTQKIRLFLNRIALHLFSLSFAVGFQPIFTFEYSYFCSSFLFWVHCVDGSNVDAIRGS